MNKSKERLNQVKNSLENIINEIDEVYYSLTDELSNEIANKEIKRQKIEKETNDIYDLLTKEICIKLIKRNLPFRIRLLNKIKWAGQGIKGNGLILICFNFNESDETFEKVFWMEEIKEYLIKKKLL
jgi:hypothetical protein